MAEASPTVADVAKALVWPLERDSRGFCVGADVEKITADSYRDTYDPGEFEPPVVDPARRLTIPRPLDERLSIAEFVINCKAIADSFPTTAGVGANLNRLLGREDTEPDDIPTWAIGMQD